MKTMNIINNWNKKYFNGQLSREVLGCLSQLDLNNEEITTFLDTYFQYFYLSGFKAKNFPPVWAQWLTENIENYMLSAWQRVPPITAKGRLKHIDEVFRRTLKLDSEKPLQVLDIGCGYPPETTLDLANAFPLWDITAIDPGMPSYILYDNEGHAACFDQAKNLVYIQRNPEQKINQFNRREKEHYINQFQMLWNQIKGSVDEAEKVRQWTDSGQLIINPITHYESNRLHFDLLTAQAMNYENTFDLIRSFAVFIYFSKEAYEQAMQKIEKALKECAYFIYGFVFENGTAPLYTIFQKQNGCLKPIEFAFSLDHISQLNCRSWWCFHENQPDKLLLANCLKVIVDDESLFSSIQSSVDQFLQQENIGYRDETGYIHLLDNPYFFERFKHLNDYLKPFAKSVCECLTRSGLQARINEVGDIAIRLEDDSKE